VCSLYRIKPVLREVLFFMKEVKVSLGYGKGIAEVIKLRKEGPDMKRLCGSFHA